MWRPNCSLVIVFPECPQFAVPDVVDAARDADLLVFVIPHQFVSGVCGQLKGNLKADVTAVSLIKVHYQKYFFLAKQNNCQY